MANKYIDWDLSTKGTACLNVGVTAYPNTFLRGGQFPLDKSSLFRTYAEALDYATNDGAAYAGQIIAVSTQPVGVWKRTSDNVQLVATVDSTDKSNLWTIFKTTDSENVGAINETFDGGSETTATLTKAVDKTTDLPTPVEIGYTFTSAPTVTAYIVKTNGGLQEIGSAGSVDELRTLVNTWIANVKDLLVSDQTAGDTEVIGSVTQDKSTGKITVTKKTLATADLPPVTLEKLTNSGTLKKIPADYLPGYVDDIVQFVITTTPPSSPAEGDVYYNNETKKLYACKSAGSWTEVTPETTKIYVSKDDGKAYRWSGSDMVVIASNLALGETATTAYRGDRGKIAYDHSQDSNRVTTAVESGFYKVAVTSEGHIASTTAVVASDIPTTAYQFADGTNKFTVTKPDGSTQDVTVTPSIAKATTSSDGLMSKEDKTKIDGIATGATKVEDGTENGDIKVTDSTGTSTQINVYTHPAYTEAAAAAKKVGVDSTGHVVLGDALAKGDVGLGNVNNTAITVSATDGVTDGTNNVTYKYTHPTTTENAAAAVKVGNDAQGHVVLGSALTKADVGLDKVVNQTITVTESSVSDGTNTFNKYVHPTTTETTAAAVKVGKDGTGHVVLGAVLTGADVGVSATTHSVTVDGTTFSHEYNETPVAAAAVKVGYDEKKHVVLGAALTKADVGLDKVVNQTITVTSTSVSDGTNTFDKYVHPTYTEAAAAAKKVGLDATGHVVLGDALTPTAVQLTVSATDGVTDGATGVTYKYTHPSKPTTLTPAAVKVAVDSNGHAQTGDALAVADISGLQTALDAKQDNLGFTGTYDKTTNPVALKDYVDTVDTRVTTLEDIQTSGTTNVVTGISVNAAGKLAVTKGTVAESDLDNALATKINNATSALHFIGIVAAIDTATGKYKTSAEGEWIAAKSGDVCIFGKKEYVCYTDKSVDPEQNKWSELGDESIYLSKTEAASTYETITNCDTIRTRVTALEADTHTHDNKGTLDAITSAVKTGYDNAVTKIADIATGATKVVDGDANGQIKVTKVVTNGGEKSETTETITVYDDSSVTGRLDTAEGNITTLDTNKADKVTVDTSSSDATLLKVKVNTQGIVAGTNAVTAADIRGISGIDATTSTSGLMTASDKTKLDGIATGAQVNVVEGAVDANGTAFTINDNKMIVIDDIIINGGSATA